MGDVERVSGGALTEVAGLAPGTEFKTDVGEAGRGVVERHQQRLSHVSHELPKFGCHFHGRHCR